MRHAIAILVVMLCALPARAITRVNSGNISQAVASPGVSAALGFTTTANDDVVVGVSWNTVTNSLDKITSADSAAAVFSIYAQMQNTTATANAAIAICRHCPAISHITPSFLTQAPAAGSTKYEANVAEYSGVNTIGITGACPNDSANNDKPACTDTATTPGITITTGDANDFLLVETATSHATLDTPTAGTGTLVQANKTGTTVSDVAGALCENTVASAGSLSCKVTITSAAAAAVGVELRSAAPAHSYQWPDCTTTDPCVVYHKDSEPLGTEATYSGSVNFGVSKTHAGNLLEFTVTHPATKTISSIVATDNSGNTVSTTWQTGGSTTMTGNQITEVRYMCNGPSAIWDYKFTFSTAPVLGDTFHIEYDEVANISTASGTGCSDGNSGANSIVGTIQPGAITTTGSDWIHTVAILGNGNEENGFAGGWEMPDDLSSILWINPQGDFLSFASVQASGTINPTAYINAVDVNQLSGTGASWNIVAQAFKASSGAGAEPGAGSWVTKSVVFNNDGNHTLTVIPYPTGGSAAAIISTPWQTSRSLVSTQDNYAGTYNHVTITDTGFDPQLYYFCFGANSTKRDRVLTVPVVGGVSGGTEIYDVANSKFSSGSGCAGSNADHILPSPNMQAAANDNVIGCPVAVATVNGSTPSVVLTACTENVGPPQGPCVSGGAGPTCSGNMSAVTWDAYWASGMTDSSHWSNGDATSFYYTTTAGNTSIDYLMANGTTSAGSGGYLEFEGQPAAAGSFVPQIGGFLVGP